MKAVVLRSFGGSEQLVLENVPDPEPSPGEIVLQVATVSINRSFDLSVRKGTYSRGAVLPLVLGADPSGTVSAIGKEVTAFKVGDRVAVMSTIACGQCQECRRGAAANCGFSRTIGVHRWGGYAEYVAVPASNAALVPETLSFGNATVIARHGAAAHNFLIDRGKLRAGETALIFGCRFRKLHPLDSRSPANQNMIAGCSQLLSFSSACCATVSSRDDCLKPKSWCCGINSTSCSSARHIGYV